MLNNIHLSKVLIHTRRECFNMINVNDEYKLNDAVNILNKCIRDMVMI